jgi:hypothetical protein
MSIHQKEKAIREKRTIEATQKNLMGVAGKLGMIGRFLGKPIRFQGSMFADCRDIEEYIGMPYGDKLENEELPMFDDEGEFISTIGYLFDGLNRGMHMEIRCMSEDNAITVYWKGYLVYQEFNGELTTYAPFPEWESKIDSLYQQAKPIAEKFQKDYRTKEELEARIAQKNFLQRLRYRWGI